MPQRAVILLIVVALAWLVLSRRDPPGPPPQPAGSSAPLAPAQARPREAPALPPPAPAQASRSLAVTPRGGLSGAEERTIAIFRAAAPSVVHVTNLTLQQDLFTRNVFEVPQGAGSGFVYDRVGHIVTNFHVIRGGSQFEVTLYDRTTGRARVVGVAPHKDLAVLRLEDLQVPLRPIPIGTSRDLVVGQSVYAIGNPFGLDHTLTTGVISGLGREIQSLTGRPIQDVIQTDAAINPGNSGGPLLDSAGRLIGVNTQIVSPSGAYAGIGFAVPVDTVQRIVPQLIEFGRVIRPGLGVTIAGEALAAQLGVEGALVLDVGRDTAAARAGIRPTRRGLGGAVIGDVIVAIDDAPVRGIQDLFRALDRYRVGDEIEVELVRDGERRRVRVTLQALED